MNFQSIIGGYLPLLYESLSPLVLYCLHTYDNFLYYFSISCCIDMKITQKITGCIYSSHSSRTTDTLHSIFFVHQDNIWQTIAVQVIMMRCLPHKWQLVKLLSGHSASSSNDYHHGNLGWGGGWWHPLTPYWTVMHAAKMPWALVLYFVSALS